MDIHRTFQSHIYLLFSLKINSIHKLHYITLMTAISLLFQSLVQSVMTPANTQLLLNKDESRLHIWNNLNRA